MHKTIVEFNQAQRRTDIPELRGGDVVRVSRKIKEGNKERTQLFEGMVIAVKGGQSSSKTVTVRKVSNGIGVELILPLNSPQINSIELIKRTRARRAKLYYIREKSAKILGKKLKEVSKDRGVVAKATAPAQEEAPAEVEPAVETAPETTEE